MGLNIDFFQNQVKIRIQHLRNPKYIQKNNQFIFFPRIQLYDKVDSNKSKFTKLIRAISCIISSHVSLCLFKN